MAPPSSIGRAELSILEYVTDHHPISVGAVAKHFAASAGLARTTVLTVMDRLRRKGFLSRKRVAGVYHYSPRVPKATLLQTLVRDFVEKTLGGSLTPFLAYLTHEAERTGEQVKELKRLVQTLDTHRREDRA
jgi:predicted transcriptional regulator